jgi:hypothetical protein
MVGCCGTRPLVFLLDAVLNSQAVGYFSDCSPGSLLGALFDLLPVAARSSVSFSTGLRFSPRRPFRLLALPDEELERRRVVRQGELVMADLSMLDIDSFVPQSPWAGLVMETLEQGRFSAMRRMVKAEESSGVETLDETAHPTCA